MEIRYSKSVTFEPTFNGNLDLPAEKRVKVTLRPLDQAAFITVQMELIELGLVDRKTLDGENRQKLQQVQLSLELAGKLRETYLAYGVVNVEKIENLTINGEPVAAATLAQEAPLLPLMIEITKKLNDISNITEDDEKN